MKQQECRRKVPRKMHPMARRFNNVAPVLASEVFSVLKGELPRRQLDNLSRGDWLAVVSATVDPSTFTDADAFRDAYMAAELMSKYPSWDIGVDKTAVALEKFHAAEESCKLTNRKISLQFGKVGDAVGNHDPLRYLFSAKRKILRLLGSFSWDHCEHLFGFGPGATSDIPHRNGDAYFKYKAKPWTTKGNAVLAHTCISRVPAWFSHVASLTAHTPDELRQLPVETQIKEMFQFEEGNRVITVPKNAKTERTIAIEPLMNSYVQKGIGRLIRSRLKRVGVDLDDQTRNQELALLGSIDGSLATIDLSSASDTVSMCLVEELLPPDWVTAIKLCRSPVGVLPDGGVVNYQKVSSMGNGFTFELESLIFWALCQAVVSEVSDLGMDHRLSVYGDDIIVPVHAAREVIDVLNYCGFSCNIKKTFVDGPFRESCGKHYFNGCDVTPLYIRKDVDTPERLIWFLNQIRRFSRLSWGLDGRFQNLYLRWAKTLPSKLQKPSIPDGYGDAALFGDFDEVIPPKARFGHEGYIGVAHVRLSARRLPCDLPYLVRQLATSSHEHPSIEDVLTARISGRRKGELVKLVPGGVYVPPRIDLWATVNVAVRQWTSYGPWLGS